MNNLKLVREIYGATQSEIAKALGISRVTIAKWENDSENRVSQSNLEKLSLFFGIGPEFFYDNELTEVVKQMLQNNGLRAKQIDSKTSIKKEEKFHEIFSNTTFKDAISKYMISMKVLLALADEGEVKDLEIVCKINEKMNSRLQAIINVRKNESEKNDDTFKELYEEFSFNSDEK